MAKKEGVNKTQAVADYLKKNPKAKAKEIAEALNKEAIEITVGHVHNIKSHLKRMSGGKKAKAPRPSVKPAETTSAASATSAPAQTTFAASTTAAPAAEATPSNPGGTVTLEEIRKVAATVKAIGGFGKLREMLSIIKELGGLKKFQELLDAMAVTE